MTDQNLPGAGNPPAAIDVAVIGGGIAGLSTAYYLQQATRDAPHPTAVIVFERDARPGGKIVTDRPAGFVIEGGPDAFITQKPVAYELCRALGLGDRLIGTNDARRKVYVLAGGRLHPLPEGVRLIAPTRLGPFLRSALISPWGKVRMGLDLLLPGRPAPGDESLAAFVRRRLGREALDKLGEPMLAGIHVGDPARLSLRATFPQLAEMERRHGSLIRGTRAARPAPPDPNRPATMFLALREGMAELPAALAAHLGPGVVRTAVEVVRMVRTGAGDGSGYRLHLSSGEQIMARQVVLATPAPGAARLLAVDAPDLAAALGAIRYVSSATISLGYRAADLPRPLDGFGFVVAAREPTRLLACTWTSTKFDHRAPQDHVLLRAFVGGAHHAELVDLPDAALLALAREELRTILGITAPPVVSRIFRWPQANPQYDVGHLERVARIERLAAAQPGLYLTGSAYRGVGIPDCVRGAKATATRIAAAPAAQASAAI
jgi:oxygen-dependent protoporphyrinogen oxidase